VYYHPTVADRLAAESQLLIDEWTRQQQQRPAKTRIQIAPCLTVVYYRPMAADRLAVEGQLLIDGWTYQRSAEM
jgi:hypothetical protein